MRYSFCIRQGYEIDFLISTGDKICPVEVKSGNYRNHKSLDNFCRKFSSRIRDKYVVHTKDYKWGNGINYIPVYMVTFLWNREVYREKKTP